MAFLSRLSAFRFDPPPGFPARSPVDARGMMVHLGSCQRCCREQPPILSVCLSCVFPASSPLYQPLLALASLLLCLNLSVFLSLGHLCGHHTCSVAPAISHLYQPELCFMYHPFPPGLGMLSRDLPMSIMFGAQGFLWPEPWTAACGAGPGPGDVL